MHADGLAATRGAILAQVAQIRRQGEVVEVDVVVIDVPRAIGMDGDARLAYRVAMLFLAGDLARTAVRAVLVIDKKSVGCHIYTSFPNFSQMRFMSVSYDSLTGSTLQIRHLLGAPNPSLPMRPLGHRLLICERKVP